MKLKNSQPFRQLILFPFEQLVQSGEVIEVDDKEKKLIKDLKASGFETVKEDDK